MRLFLLLFLWAATAAARPEPATGRLIPKDAAPLLAPPNVFSLPGWRSVSDEIELLSLKADGATVQAGEVVAEFRLRTGSASDYIERMIRDTKARGKESEVRLAEEVEALAHEQARLTLAAERAALDAEAASARAAREQARLLIDARVARFEAKAAARLLIALRRHAEATRVADEARLAAKARNRELFESYTERYKLRAPFAGVMRHVYLTSRKRTAQKGDTLSSGLHFASVARTGALTARFYVPEGLRGTLKPGLPVQVTAASGGAVFGAVLREVEPFPQELGALEDDWTRADARERFYVVLADLAGTPAVPPGAEVRVNLP